MKKTIFCLIVSIIIFSIGVRGLEPVYNVDITLERHPIYLKPKVISIDSFDVVAGMPTPQTIYTNKPATYVFRTFNKDNELLAEYFYSKSFIAEDTRKIFDIIDLTIALPYNPLARYLEIFNQGKLLLRYELPKFCIEDGICSMPENYYTCPNDCLAFADDGVCIPTHDGQCDSDCRGIEDLDCTCGDGICQEYENEEICADDCNTTNKFATATKKSAIVKPINLRFLLLIILLIITAAITGILIGKYRYRKNQRGNL